MHDLAALFFNGPSRLTSLESLTLDIPNIGESKSQL